MSTAVETAKRPALRLENGAWRLLFAGSAAAILVAGLVPLIPYAPDFRGFLAGDYWTYLHATQDWLAGRGFYEAHQLAGPYPITGGDILYPPVALWLFMPFTFLPAVMWWAIPFAVIGWTWRRLRPAVWAWPIMAGLIVYPWALARVIDGNPLMYVLAAFSVGTVYAGPAVLVLIKPSLFPFALWGIRHRRWWLWLAVFGLACIPFGAMWLDWLTVMANSRPSADEGGGLLYSARDIPTMCLPIIVWLASPGALAKVRLKVGWAPPQSTAQPAEH